MMKFAIAVSAVVLMAGTARAEEDALAMREGAMQANSFVMATLAGMAKGDIAFDAKKVEGGLEAMRFIAATFANHFPEGSGGGDSTASPKVWEDAAGFAAANEKWRADVQAALDNPPTDVASLGAAVGKIGGNCKSCHENFRIKK
ncbi:cytochrome C signal peptide protein [Zhengella mangrovi]|uniref:Cytochrome C signal peptide protein n=1 Tax=Zhengella mangrovi TaxID=1982044 RepID=A0A2G1QHY5_9HYPH|nr:cytochrome c [Zhengella mangrovi]PHP65157.1 cytochrome C signal peptide protein [Zhengella mangrovi]